MIIKFQAQVTGNFSEERYGFEYQENQLCDIMLDIDQHMDGSYTVKDFSFKKINQ